MYRITKSVHVPFSHHVRGHRGACISLHGHTWKLEVGLGASTLDAEGFVTDFSVVKARVLRPCHRLLDHALALGEETFAEVRADLEGMGHKLVDSRLHTIGDRGERPEGLDGTLGGARNVYPGGIKVALFPFAPTSERIAEWLYRVAVEQLEDGRVRVLRGRVYESLHPTESIGEFVP
ncbi:MAG: 6-pyruvoyl tetrahydropterin synthase family protein [Sandaracinaceae bacterium]